MSVQQHIFGFDITMDQFLIMGILQSISDLLDIGDDRSNWKDGSLWMSLSQRPTHGVVHHQKGCFALYAKFEDTHDMGMDQVSYRMCLCAEAFDIVIGQLGVEHLMAACVPR